MRFSKVKKILNRATNEQQHRGKRNKHAEASLFLCRVWHWLAMWLAKLSFRRCSGEVQTTNGLFTAVFSCFLRHFASTVAVFIFHNFFFLLLFFRSSHCYGTTRVVVCWPTSNVDKTKLSIWNQNDPSVRVGRKIKNKKINKGKDLLHLYQKYVPTKRLAQC